MVRLMISPPNDTDVDGLPDFWEQSYGCMKPSTVDDGADYDGDSLTNQQEYAAVTNPCLADTDSDGMDDDWELANACMKPSTNDAAKDPDGDALDNLAENSNSTAPCDPDTDDDGMTDGWEVDNGLEPDDDSDAAGDADGDGFTNLQEFLGGSDPNDPASQPGLSSGGGGISCAPRAKGASPGAGLLGMGLMAVAALFARRRPEVVPSRA